MTQEAESGTERASLTAAIADSKFSTTSMINPSALGEILTYPLLLLAYKPRHPHHN